MTKTSNSSTPAVRTVVYSFVVADLLHYGHLQLLQTAKQLGDFHICGVLTDDAAASYRARPITNFDERVAIVSNMRVVDRVMAQEQRDPTENLHRVRAEYPDAELVLVHGNDWKEIPGRAFVESVGGRVVQPEYYRRLSDSHIRQELAQATPGGAVHYEAFTEHFRIDHLHVFEAEQRPFVLSTKANTLRALAPLVRQSRIEPMLTFRVAEWGESRTEIVSRIRKAFGPGRVVVRSSAINEDTYHRSQAGCFESRVNVPTTPRGLASAIDAVVASYPAKGNDNPLNQVLVQPHTAHVCTSGVVFTREPRSGGAYYVINYDDRTGSTESVTSGVENQALDVAHQCPPARWPAAWRGLLEAVREIEAVIPGTPLDIEFAIDRRDRVVTFQVRPLAVGPLPAEMREAASQMLAEAAVDVRRWSAPVVHLAGATNVFSDMAFWNPAEIIGDRPKALAESLYRHVIMDAVWHEALAPLGYVAVGPAPLMRCFGGKPYVDFRATANALVPATVSKALRLRLVRDSLTRLGESPELHDKIEFAIVDNCYFFTLDASLKRMQRRGFTPRDVAAYRAGLVGVTTRAFAYTDRIEAEVAQSAEALAQARARAVAAAEGRTDAATLLAVARALLDDVRDSGTRPFSLMARLAFVGKRVLRSVVERDWMTERDYDAFMDQVRTVATEISEDDAAVTAGRLNRAAFLDRYGHLRPGTYDITSLRYADEPSYFGLERAESPQRRGTRRAFRLAPAAATAINRALKRDGFALDAEGLLRFVRLAIEARERVKFEFTKNLSDAVEWIARAGESRGHSREDMAHLTVQELARPDQWPVAIAAARTRHQVAMTLSLPPLVMQPEDLLVVQRPTARPNFVTQRAVRADLVVLSGPGAATESLEGKVVVIEQADPGFDWVFTKRIAGLITKYGGVASHMAIRCAEFGLPAAIGCGDVLYRQLMTARGVYLDCAQGHVRPIR